MHLTVLYFMMMLLSMAHLVMIHLMGRHTHHFQHGGAARSEEADHEYGGDEQEDNVEHGGVVPLDAASQGDDIAVLWNDPQGLKQEFDHIASSCHGDIEGQQNIAHNLPAIVFAIDVQDWQDDQIGKDEADNSTKANPAPPQHGS